MKFSEITAQKMVADYMRRAVSSLRLSHAYILDGERGMGKRTLADTFAKALLCENRSEKSPEPCGTCKSCRMAAGSNHPDIIYLTHEKKHISVEDIRQQIVSSVDISPDQSDYKIYIIDEADEMTIQAQNALLKSLEEPPGYVVMLLLAGNSNRLLETIRSRCVALYLSATPDDIVRDIVRSKSAVTDYRIEACIAFAQGNVGKALVLVEDEGFEELKNNTFSLMGKLDKIDDLRLYETAGEIEDAGEFLDLLLIYFRDVLVYRATGRRDVLSLKDEAYQICRWADDISDLAAGSLYDCIAEARRMLDSNGQKALVMENLLFRLKEIRTKI